MSLRGTLAQLQRRMTAVVAVVAVGQAQIDDDEFGDAPRTSLGQGIPRAVTPEACPQPQLPVAQQ